MWLPLVAGAAVLAYVAASLLLLRRPDLLHKRKTHSFSPSHISHRGGAGEWTENTITAFTRAMDNKTHMFELDVQMTRDKEVVLLHERRLDRLTGQPGHVGHLDYADLPPLQTTLRVEFAPHMPHTTVTDPEKIARLEDMFTLFPDMPMNIDVKDDNDLLIESVAAMVEKFNRQPLVVWGNANETICRKLHKRLPEVPLLFSTYQYIRLYILFYLGLLPFCSITPDFLEIPMPRSLIPLTKSRVQHFVLRLLDYLTMSPILFGHLHRRGVQVLLWVVNSQVDFERACGLGAHGVMTDYPSMLTSLLETPQAAQLRNHKDHKNHHHHHHHSKKGK